MTIAYHERPGVEIIQEFRSTNVSIQTPAMPPCIVGPAFEVVEAVLDDGSLNAKAQLALPAQIPMSWVSANYTFASGLSLYVEVDNAAEAEVPMPATANPTPEAIVTSVLIAAIPGLTAVVEESGAQKRVVLRTTGTGDYASLRIGASTLAGLLAPLGVRLGQLATGRLGYTNHLDLVVSEANYPNPRGNLSQLDVDFTTVRAFVANGAGSVKEPLRTESLLNGGASAVAVVDDGDGDNLSPYFSFASANFRESAATMTGTVDLTTLNYGVGGDFDPPQALVIAVDGAAPVTVTLDHALLNVAGDVVAAINTALGAPVASLNGSNQLVLTSTTQGAGSKLELGTAVASPASAILGLTDGAVATGAPAPARATGIADITALVWATQVHGRNLRMSIDGGDFQLLTMPATIASAANLVSAINALWGAGVARLTNGNQLELNSLASFGGVESVVRIDKAASDSTLLTALGLTGVGAPFQTYDYVRGSAFAVVVGDEVWINGVRVGTVNEIPVGYTNRLRLNVEKALTFTGSSWFVKAKGLQNVVQTATRPTPELLVDEQSGTVRFSHAMFYDTAGRPTPVGPVSAYLAYTALRLDIAASGNDSTLQRSGSLTDIQDRFGPIDAQNPFGLGMYLCKLTSGAFEVAGVGVNDVSTSEPEGTADAYAAAFEFLESKDVYNIVPLTHSVLVAQLGQIHVDTMSLPENGLNRRLIFNPSRPTRATDVVVASGPTANVTGAPTNDISTGVADLAMLLASAGHPGPSYTESDGVYVELENDTNKYLVQSISGGVVTINAGPLTTGSPFYDAGGSNVFASAIVDRPFSVKVYGAALANLTEEAEAYSDIGRIFQDRRVLCTMPDKGTATIDGLDTLLEGYFMNCALAGVMAAKLASQPLTEAVLPGFKAANGSADRYGETQLKIISAGGLWVFYTESDIVKTRQQLTTDMSSIEKQESSITEALDYSDKTMRISVKAFIGRVNLTQNVQDSVSTVAAGVGSYLVRSGILKSFALASIKQMEDRPDGLEIEADVGVLYPLNKIRIRFVV